MPLILCRRPQRNTTHAPPNQTCQPYLLVPVCSDPLHHKDPIMRPPMPVLGPGLRMTCLSKCQDMAFSPGLSPALLVGPWTHNLDLCFMSHEFFLNVPTGFCFWLSIAQTSPRNLVGWEAIPHLPTFLIAATSALFQASSLSDRIKASKFLHGTNL